MADALMRLFSLRRVPQVQEIALDTAGSEDLAVGRERQRADARPMSNHALAALAGAGIEDEDVAEVAADRERLAVRRKGNRRAPVERHAQPLPSGGRVPESQRLVAADGGE